MRSALLTLATLLLGFALLQMSNALQGTLLAVRAGIEGFSATSIGLISSGFSLGMCLGAFQAGKLIQRAGHIRTFAALASLASSAALIHLLFIDPLGWILVRTMTGFCFAGLFVTVESWLNASAGSTNRGQLLSVYAMCGMGAGTVGQLLFTVAEPSSYMLFVLVSIGMSVALVPISLSRATAPVPEGPQEPPSIRRLWEFSPFGAIATCLVGASIGTFFGLAPLFAQRIGFEQSEIAALMATATFGGMVLQYPLGWLSDRVNRRAVSIALAGATLVICLGVARLQLPPLAIALALAFLLGGILLPAVSIVIAHVNDRAPPEALLAVSGALVLLSGLGAAIGPLLGGMMMEQIGPLGLLYTIALLQAAIAAYGLYRIFILEGPTAEEKGSFNPVPMNRVMAELEQQALEDSNAELEPSSSPA